MFSILKLKWGSVLNNKEKKALTKKQKQLDLSSVVKGKTEIDTHYTVWMNHFITDGHLKIIGATNFAVYATLRADYSLNSNWKGFPDWKELEDMTGLTYKTLKSSVSKLEGLEYLQVKWKDETKKTKPLTYKIIEKIHYRNPRNPELLSGYAYVLDKMDLSSQKKLYDNVSNNKTINPSEEQKQRWSLEYREDFKPVINKYYVNVVVGDNNKLTIINEAENFIEGELGLMKAIHDRSKDKALLTKEGIQKVIEEHPQMLPTAKTTGDDTEQ